MISISHWGMFSRSEYQRMGLRHIDCLIYGKSYSYLEFLYEEDSQ